MEILRYTRRLMITIGYLSGERTNRFQFVHSIIPLLIVLNLSAGVIATVIFVLRHCEEDIENCLHASNGIVGAVPMIASCITIVYHKEKVRIVIDTFQKISEKCKLYHVSLKNEFLNLCCYLRQALINRRQFSSNVLTYGVRRSWSMQSLLVSADILFQRWYSLQ